MDQINRDGFTYYRSFHEASQYLPPELYKSLAMAINNYALNGILPTELPNEINGFFLLIKPQIDANIKRYLNGKKPKTKQTESKTEAHEKQEESKSVTNKNNNKNNNKEEKLEVEYDMENPISAEELEKIDSFKSFLKTKKKIQMDRVRMQHKLTESELNLKIDEFVEKKVSWEDDNWKNESDMAKNFEFWLNKNPAVNQNSFKNWSKNKFFEEVKNITGNLSKEVKQDFFNHYSQPTESGAMLFQSYPAWDTKTRLQKWINKQKE